MKKIVNKNLIYVPILLIVLIALPYIAQTQNVTDSWGGKVYIKTSGNFSNGGGPGNVPANWYAMPIHGMFLYDSQFLFLGKSRPEKESPASQVKPYVFRMAVNPVIQTDADGDQYTVVDEENIPFDPNFSNDQTFCAGHTFLSDGRAFIVGGQRNDPAIEGGEGLPYALLYTPATASWVRTANMVGTSTNNFVGRWYPTATQSYVANKVFVSHGYQDLVPLTMNDSIEMYQTNTSSWNVISDAATTPDETHHSATTYTHVFQLPQQLSGDYNFLYIAKSAKPWFMTVAGIWNNLSAPVRPSEPGDTSTQPNLKAASTLLPQRVTNNEWGYNNGSIIVAGGDDLNSYEKRTDVYDPIANVWQNKVTIFERQYSAAVLLPDSQALVINGSNDNANEDERLAEYIAPRNSFARSLGTSPGAVVRGYHSVAFLLGDGKVLVVGGRPFGGGSGTEATHFQIYNPVYRQGQAQPVITSATSTVQYNTNFTINYNTANPTPEEVVLMAIPSMTHSFDHNQRSIQLQIVAQQSGALQVKAPADSKIAPPGYYYLFIVDTSGTIPIPSSARVIKLIP